MKKTSCWIPPSVLNILEHVFLASLYTLVRIRLMKWSVSFFLFFFCCCLFITLLKKKGTFFSFNQIFIKAAQDHKVIMFQRWGFKACILGWTCSVARSCIISCFCGMKDWGEILFTHRSFNILRISSKNCEYQLQKNLKAFLFVYGTWLIQKILSLSLFTPKSEK